MTAGASFPTFVKITLYIFLQYPSLAAALQLSKWMQEEKHEAN